MIAVENRERAALPEFSGLFRTPARGAPITARSLGRRFGDLHVLRSLELHVPAGQFLAIVGRSGCGKSTLLRILSGLDRPTSGEYWLGDAAAKGTRAEARIMFQEPRLLPWANVLENVEVGLAGAAGATDSRFRALEALAAVGLEDRADNWPSVLSGGQKQRVALARALVSRPRFLALDEPLGALDALTRIEMQALIERMWLESGFTAVLVTHDVSEALALADRVVMIEDGRIALDIPVTLPRPRRRGSVDLAMLEERILAQLLQREKIIPEYVI
ncbi:MAG: ATP-binding cassette domain-containing protein [Rhodoblastus sp.]